jgi:hypothetical protein
MSDQEAEFIDVDEVLPPGQEPKKKGPLGKDSPPKIPRSPVAKLVAYILDECITLPGTKFKIGLDPILGLIPGAGEAVASVAGAMIIGEAYKKGVSLKTVSQMSGNLLLNAGVGAIPGLGDIFSASFKSNKKNYEILDDYLNHPPPTGKARKLWPVVLFLGLTSLALNLGVLFLFWWGVSAIWR